MITPSFSPTATERVLPKLALDFTTASLDPRVTFTRTTDATHPATYFNSDGFIVNATNNQPRFDYGSTTLTCKGLLIEESRTNLLPYSSTYTTWTTIRSSLAQNATISPDGSNNAVSLIEDSGTSLAKYTSYSLSVNGAITFSYYAKAGVRTWTAIRIYDGSVDRLAFFNLSNGTIGTVTSGVTASIIKEKNDWYRCCFTYTFPSASIVAQILITTGDNVVNYTGNGTSNIYIYGAQLEAGAFATSYIPTTSAALTRNADVATMTGTNFSDWWTATTGAANVSVIPKSAVGTKPLFQIDDNTADNIISLRGNVANPELYIKATTDQLQIDAGTIVANTAYKLAGAWNTDNCVAAQNGAAAVTDTSATIPTVTQARIGSDGTNYANAWLQKINYWPQRITNNETQAFSK